MSKTISKLALGTEIWINENGVDTPYILIRKDTAGCVLLRAVACWNKRMHSSNVSVYEGCEMDEYLCDAEAGFLSRFNASTISTLASRSIPTYSYTDTECHYISRKCFIPSYGELFNNSTNAKEPETSVVVALMIYKQVSDVAAARQAINDSSVSSVNWWLRSPCSATYFFYVYSNGTSSYISASNTSNSFRPALNVSPDTIVSDVGADKIYLVAPESTTKTIEFVGKLGESASRPTKVFVKCVTGNCQNVTISVTNNYGDTNPVWEQTQNEHETILLNENKQTDAWELGIHCYGEIANLGHGYFEEPVVLVEVE